MVKQDNIVVCLVLGKTVDRVRIGNMEGAWLEGLRDGRGPGGIAGDMEGWKNAGRGAGWEGLVTEA